MYMYVSRLGGQISQPVPNLLQGYLYPFAHSGMTSIHVTIPNSLL